MTRVPWLVCHVPLPTSGSPRWAVRRYLVGRFSKAAFPAPQVRLTRIAARPLPQEELCAALWPVLCEVAERLELTSKELPRRIRLEQRDLDAAPHEEEAVSVRIEIVGGASASPGGRHDVG